jgi:Nucleotidyltransferase domain
MLDRAGNAVNPTDTTPFLRALARRLADSYGAHAQPSAILLVGSVATGGADAYSDLDMLLYYAQVPPDAKMAKTPREVGAERYQGTPWSDESGESDERGYSERYSVDDIECQIGHMSVGSFDREIRRVVVDLEVNEELLKIMSGLFEGLPLFGNELIERWRRKPSTRRSYSGQPSRSAGNSFPGGTSRRNFGRETPLSGATRSSCGPRTTLSVSWRL